MIDLEDFNYYLPGERIAQHPENKRDHSKLMVIKKNSIQHKKFHHIVQEMEEGDVVVANNSKVIAANLKGRKETGGKIECLFLREIDPQENTWECLLRGRKLRESTKIQFLNGQIIGTIIKWKKLGQFIVKFSSEMSIKKILKDNASITLPPYIKEPQEDFTRYQTIYALDEGSIAAPTAGFHFTSDLIKKIKEKGAKFVFVTLHVGYSTFMRLNLDILTSHKMDPEFFSITNSVLDIIQECQERNRKLFVVGTSTLKALESATNNKGKITIKNGWSDLFIAPGYSFKSGVSRMLTNFHMPKSSPLLMVCAFAGKDRILNSYKEAILKNYRFYSFGDAMLVDGG